MVKKIFNQKQMELKPNISKMERQGILKSLNLIVTVLESCTNSSDYMDSFISYRQMGIKKWLTGTEPPTMRIASILKDEYEIC